MATGSRQIVTNVIRVQNLFFVSLNSPSPSDSLLIPNLCFDFLVFFVFFVFFLLPNWSSWRYLSDLLVAKKFVNNKKIIKTFGSMLQ